MAVTTQWPWPWVPEAHWLNSYGVNLSLVSKEKIEALNLGYRGKPAHSNHSHPLVKWVVVHEPDWAIIENIYRSEYEEGEEMYICFPVAIGEYPEGHLERLNSTSEEQTLQCKVFDPNSNERSSDLGTVYRHSKPEVDILIALCTAITVFGSVGMFPPGIELLWKILMIFAVISIVLMKSSETRDSYHI